MRGARGREALARSRAAQGAGGLRRGLDMLLKIIIFAPFPLSRKVGTSWRAGQVEPADQSSRLTAENRKAFGEVGIEVSAALDLESSGQTANERECGALGGGNRLSGRGPLRGRGLRRGLDMLLKIIIFAPLPLSRKAGTSWRPGIVEPADQGSRLTAESRELAAKVRQRAPSRQAFQGRHFSPRRTQIPPGNPPCSPPPRSPRSPR
jgi:hypothetical protein